MPKLARKYEEPFILPLPFDEALQRFATVNTKDIATELEEPADEGKAAPFVKWVGGKRSIVDELVARMPKKYGAFHEAFVGGGALFFELADKLTTACLSDTNFDLVITYNVIKKDLPKLIAALKKHADNHNEEYYYKIRARHELQDPIDVAARFLYLNKTCYNGLYRVNRKGEFNVPMGSYTNPGIVNEKNLLACSKALQKVTIELKGFDMIKPASGDFCYFDPPYHPTSNTSFTAYSKMDFGEKEQISLRDFALELHKKGVLVMLSNSDAKFIRGLFNSSPFKIQTVHAPRLVNCKPNGRDAVKELLITNY